ncbi:hypothetical protein AVEN_113208-1 [Araneus ventricosus]|uniref:Uncharacterized protein n=1 Tax=Araneus ventricosus TaxID=182803 RepID=A0A4Y2L6A9_ARAVE|nr:hypothetical protein AVEN_113208-1 [Araneus ventricosus]
MNFLKCPALKQHEGYLGTDFIILNRCQMTRTTPDLAPPPPNFRATTYDLACNRPHTRRIFSGIGSRTCEPAVPRTRPTLGHRGLVSVMRSSTRIS